MVRNNQTRKQRVQGGQDAKTIKRQMHIAGNGGMTDEPIKKLMHIETNGGSTA